MLPWIPRISYGSVAFDLSLPQRPWELEDVSVGGYEESAALTPSAWEYSRSEHLRLRFRVWEHELPAVRAWIAAGQRVQPIQVNLCQVGASTPVYLVSPRMGERFAPQPAETPGLWEVEVVVRTVDGSSLYEPYYDELSGINLLRNPGFEEGGDYWAVPLSSSWLGPGAGAEVEVVDTTGAGRTIQVLPPTPIADLGLSPGDLASAVCEAISDSGGRATLGIAWGDATQNVIRYDTADTRVASWQRLPVEARQVPEGTVSVRLYIQSRDLTTSRFRSITFGPGSSAPPYLSAAVRDDPAGAHSGRRHLEVYQANGQALIHQRDASGAIRYIPVSPGDVVQYGVWCQRLSGDGRVRLRLTAVDAGKGGHNYLSSSDVANPGAGWILSANSYTVPAGKAYVYATCQISDHNTLGTTARFDDVYLRIKRGPR